MEPPGEATTEHWDPDVVGDLAHLLGRRWVVSVIAALWDGPMRRKALQAKLGAVSDKVLTHTLRDLEHHGIVVRHLHDQWPPRVDYDLTPRGHALAPVFIAMTRWAAGAGPWCR